MGDRQVSGQTPTAQALGPYAAGFSLRAGGELDGVGNGAGARSLASGGPPITTASTCFAGWCGTLTKTATVVLAGYQWYQLNAVQAVPQPGETKFWFNEGGAQVYVVDAGNNYDTGGGNVFGCQFPGQSGGGRNYLVYVINGSSPYLWWWPNGTNGGCRPCVATKTPRLVTGCIRLGESNSAATNPWEVTQDRANLWAQGQIDGGHWPDVVKPALDGAIRPAVT